MIEKTLAAITIALCVVLLARMVLGERRRHRFDAVLRRAFYAVRRVILKAWRWPSRRREAARAADEAIRRARRDGNVYKADSFRPPRKPH